MRITTEFFKPGKLSVVMDGQYGSSGKGKMSSYLGEKCDNWQFAINAFMSNAAHTVISQHGKFGYQCLNSVAYLTSKYEKTYICGGAVTELEPLFREIEENRVKPGQLGIHPLVAVVTQKDIDYERGACSFEGEPKPESVISDNMTFGSTLHGVGAARARRILRRKDVLLARDIPELAPYICDTRKEILDRLDAKQAGLLEIAQGYTLGYLEDRFYPKTTSRNCTVSAALDDCGIPPFYVGNVLINLRTYPIRVSSDKWTDDKGRILKYREAVKLQKEGHRVNHIKGDSGKVYEDQKELTWEELTLMHGHSTPLYEESTLTQNPRRVFTFSKQNVRDAVRHNLPPEGNELILSLNFINYACPTFDPATGTQAAGWIKDNMPEEHISRLKLLGYGAHTGETLEII